jgi:ubiquinone/menaquinone biosynthesis C-methylase UbiE
VKYLIRILMKLGLANYVAKQLSKPSGFFGSRIIGRMMNSGNAHLEKTALAYAEVAPDHHVLEIGFGNGKFLGTLCSVVEKGKVYGADISEDLVNQVSSRLKNQIKACQLELHLAGISQLPFDDNSLDRIITCNTIYFWPEPLADAKELLRILKPNGKLVIGYRTTEEMEAYPFVAQNLDIFVNRYSDDEVDGLLKQAGFCAVSTAIEPFELAPSHVAVAIK